MLSLSGPGKAGLWVNNENLFDPHTKDTSERVAIFKRIRAPVKKGDPENRAEREKQATERWIPNLSGNDGKLTSDNLAFYEKSSVDSTSPLGDMPGGSNPKPWNPNRFASLTELQYKRLQKWSEGKFVTGEKIVRAAKFEDIDLQKQPEALTTAGLEWSIGGPLFPGIECCWRVEFGDMYKISDRYRFADTVTPGDLSKGLPLPWQTGFFLCNTNWYASLCSWITSPRSD